MLQERNIVAIGERNNSFTSGIPHREGSVPGPSTSALPVYYGATDLTYSVPFDFPETILFQLVALLDVNGDGELDAVIAYAKGGSGTPIPIDVLLGDGAGGFTLGTSSIFGGSPPAPDGPGVFPIVVDFNGDDRLDVYMNCAGLDGGSVPGALSVLLLSDGATGFVDASANLPAFTDFNLSSSAADIDGDHDIDIFVANRYNPDQPEGHFGPYIILNDGNGVFTDTGTDLLPVEWQTDTIAELRDSFLFFDADGDGDPDLFAGGRGNYDTPSQILRNDGAGHFAFWVEVPVPEGIPPGPVPPPDYAAYISSTQAIDLNDDGKLDLVARWNMPIPRPGEFQILINRGAGVFTDETFRLSEYLQPNNVANAAFFTPVDVDGDGHTDFVSDMMPNSGRPIYLNDGGGHFIRLPEDFFDILPNNRIAPSDFNDDGRLDFLVTVSVGSGEADIRVMLGEDPGLTLTGNGSANALMGDASAETLSGLGGDDMIFAAQGNDTADGGAGDDTIIAGAGDDDITGGADDDFLAGGPGNDEIDGGTGTDTASYRDATSGVTVSLDNVHEQITGGGGRDRLLSIENLIGSDSSDKLTGNTGGNEIDGGEGNDKLDGGGGKDYLTGGLGNDELNGGADVDTATYADSFSGVTVSLATTKSQNTVSAGKDALSGIENLVGSAFSDKLTGSDAINVLIAGLGDDVLEGGKGGDALDGGKGLDLASYASANAGVVVHMGVHVAVAGLGSDTWTSIEGIIGTRFNDTLKGSVRDDLLIGGNGNDALNGDKGDDTLRGGAGNEKLDGSTGFDLADYSDAGSRVVINLSLVTQDTMGAGTDTFKNIEGVIGSRFNDLFTGSSRNDTIFGGAGNDTLTGGDGADTLNPGAGTDAIDGGDGSDTISVANAPEGMTIHLQQSFFEKQDGSAGMSGTVVNVENATGSSNNDTLIGTDGDNVIMGGVGSDWLQGQGGGDVLFGGIGDDSFFYDGNLNCSTPSVPDLIADLGQSGNNDDTIMLDAYDANIHKNGDQAFAIVSHFTHKAGQLTIAFDSTHHRTVVSGDIDGDAHAEVVIYIDGNHADFTNFVL